MDGGDCPAAEFGVVILGVALAGGVGALIRWLVGIWFSERGPRGVGTGVVNLVGAFGLGLVIALVDSGRFHPDAGLVLGVGLLGGMTTFSTWMVETVQEPAGRPSSAWLRLAPLTVAGMALVWIGMQFGGVGN